MRVELVEGGPVIFPFTQDGDPAQPGLGAIQDELGIKQLIIIYGYAPFFIMILDKERVGARPAAAIFIFHRRHFMVDGDLLRMKNPFERTTSVAPPLKRLLQTRDTEVYLTIAIQNEQYWRSKRALAGLTEESICRPEQERGAIRKENGREAMNSAFRRFVKS